MRMLAFASRTRREILRDPITYCFSLALPVVILLLIQYVNRSVSQGVDIPIFRIERFAPGIIVFSYSFLSMLTALLLSKDRSTSFLLRVFASPLTAAEYLAAYSLPMFGLALGQTVLCYAAAAVFGLQPSWNMLLSFAALLPVAALHIALGLLLGALLSDRQAPPITSIIIQVSALSSGMWFDLEQIGGAFRTVCYCLPFAHSVDLVKYALAGELSKTFVPLLIVLAFVFVVSLLAACVFRRRMRGE